MTAVAPAPGRLASIGEAALAVPTAWRFAALAAAVTSIGIWIPSSSQDEAMTASAVDRSLPELWRMTSTTVDAVHGLYYAVAHFWYLATGSTVVGLRVFSVLGVAVAVAGVVKVAHALGGDRAGTLAGFAALTVPMVTWTATEARSYAWVFAVTTWATVALLRALRDGGRRWITYGALAALASLLFIYSALVIVCHVAAVLFLARGRRSRALGLVAWAAALAAAVPVAALGYHERAQVDWIGPFTPDMLQSAVLQWFGDSQPVATVGWTLIVVAIGAAIRQLVVDRRASQERRAASALLIVVVPWLLVPTALLLAATAAGRPSYVPRYAAVSVGAVVVLLAFAAAFIARRASLVVALLGVLCLPTFVAQRLPMANGDDWSTSAAVVADCSRPGDAFYFAQTGAAVDPRLMLPAYRSDFDSASDMALWATAAQSANLTDAVAPAAEALRQSHDPKRVIVIADNAAPWWNSGDQAAFTAAGYTAVDSVKNATTTVLLLTRR